MENKPKDHGADNAKEIHMSQQWHTKSVPFKFMLSDKTLFIWRIQLQVRSEGLNGTVLSTAQLQPEEHVLDKSCQGFLIRSQPMLEKQPVMSRLFGYQIYIPHQYQRHYIALDQPFEQYNQKFSSKSRKTLRRKIKKFTEYCNGECRIEQYSEAAQLDEFFRLATELSAKTYQDKLLDAGLPSTAAFIGSAKQMADRNELRAYLLFDGERPVSYLYCPVKKGNMLFQYLGYDPDYAKFSVGTILQWLALELIFTEQCFKTFDFTEGDSEHKRFFATDSIKCADVYILRQKPLNWLLIRAHNLMNGVSQWCGEILQRLGIKPWVQRLIRRQYTG